MMWLVLIVLLLAPPALAFTAEDLRQKVEANAGCSVTEMRWIEQTKQWIAIYDASCTNEQMQRGEATKIQIGRKTAPDIARP